MILAMAASLLIVDVVCIGYRSYFWWVQGQYKQSISILKVRSNHILANSGKKY